MSNRYKNKTDFFSVYNAICDINEVKPKTLTSTQFTILMVILSHTNKDSKEAFPKQETIRKKCGIGSDTTYYKAFKPLLEQGWIIQRKRFNASACYQVVIPDDIYDLLVSTVSTESVESVSTESVESVSTESVDLTTNNNNKYITTNIINNKNEKTDCHVFVDTQTFDNLTTNNVSNDTIQNINEIDYEFMNDIIYNENECIYENVDEENENQLSVTELIEIHGTDKDMIKSNPYAKQWIVNTMLSIIDYNINNDKAQESIMNWIDKNDYLIWYFYQELNKHKYDYEFISSIDKEKRLNTLKSKLKEETQEWYERNESDEVEVYNGDYGYLYEF